MRFDNWRSSGSRRLRLTRLEADGLDHRCRVTGRQSLPTELGVGTRPYSIAFGDFKRGYLIVDRQGVHVLRDPFTAKPYVLFYTTKRVGGGVQDFDAIKLMKFATS